MRQKVEVLDNIIAEITGASGRVQTGETVLPTVEKESYVPKTTPATVPTDGGMSFIRWDNIKQFLKGIAANKMWETWTKFIENFEIAASLSNAHDPVKRSQLLLLSVGDELQAIILSAKLRPTSNDLGCYVSFKNNIEAYLKLLTDTSAEHDAFLTMQQEKAESAVNFHARLMEKVWLRDNSSSEQDRFVRTQLIRGLKNRELAKAARTYGYMDIWRQTLLLSLRRGMKPFNLNHWCLKNRQSWLFPRNIHEEPNIVNMMIRRQETQVQKKNNFDEIEYRPCHDTSVAQDVTVRPRQSNVSCCEQEL